MKQLQEYYNYLNKNKNAIIEEMEKEEARKMAEKMKFDAEEARKRDEAERKRLKEEEDRLIEQKRKEEEEKIKAIDKELDEDNAIPLPSTGMAEINNFGNNNL